MITKKDKSILEFIDQYGSITINQCAKVFYPPRFGYDYARKKLHLLQERGVLKFTHDPILDEHIYFTDKTPTPHNNAVLNFYANCIAFKLPVRAFEREKSFNDKRVRADAFCVWESSNGPQIGIIEVDLYHNTDIKKWENIKDLLIELYGDIPYLIILSLTPRKICSKDITIINMDLKCSDFIEKVLPL